MFSSQITPKKFNTPNTPLTAPGPPVLAIFAVAFAILAAMGFLIVFYGENGYTYLPNALETYAEEHFLPDTAFPSVSPTLIFNPDPCRAPN